MSLILSGEINFFSSVKPQTVRFSVVVLLQKKVKLYFKKNNIFDLLKDIQCKLKLMFKSLEMTRSLESFT